MTKGLKLTFKIGIPTKIKAVKIKIKDEKAENALLIQVHALTLPPDAPAGAQRVEIGVYSPVTLQRHPLFLGIGEHTAPHNRVLTESLAVQ